MIFQIHFPFVIEVIEIQENETIIITDTDQPTTLAFDNVFQLIKEHQQYPSFYYNRILTEIDFISPVLAPRRKRRRTDFT